MIQHVGILIDQSFVKIVGFTTILFQYSVRGLPYGMFNFLVRIKKEGG